MDKAPNMDIVEKKIHAMWPSFNETDDLNLCWTWLVHEDTCSISL